MFNDPLPFDPDTLAKLAPALQSTETIGVWPATTRKSKGDKLSIWGFAPPLRGYSSLSLRTIEPGQIILSSQDSFKVGITGLRAQFVNDIEFRHLSDLFGRVRSIASPPVNLLVERARRRDLEVIAMAMRAHGHGGTLLIVTNNNATLQDSVDIHFNGPRYERVRKDLQERDRYFAGHHSTDFNRIFERAQQSLRSIGQLTAVDGATVVSTDLSVLGFGATIKPITELTPASLVLISEPFDGSKTEEKHLSEPLWGHRHKSAIQTPGRAAASI